MKIEVLNSNQIPQSQEFYSSIGCFQKMHSTDVAVAAFDASEIVGLVRLANEHGRAILRGMIIAPEFQRKGIGSLVLTALEKRLSNDDCYCIPHGWLEGFTVRSDSRKSEKTKRLSTCKSAL